MGFTGYFGGDVFQSAPAFARRRNGCQRECPAKPVLFQSAPAFARRRNLAGAAGVVTGAGFQSAPAFARRRNPSPVSPEAWPVGFNPLRRSHAGEIAGLAFTTAASVSFNPLRRSHAGEIFRFPGNAFAPLFQSAPAFARRRNPPSLTPFRISSAGAVAANHPRTSAEFPGARVALGMQLFTFQRATAHREPPGLGPPLGVRGASH